MSVLFIPQANYRIDDALFWLKGFAAASVDQTASADALRLVEGLREVKDYLCRLGDGDVTFLSEHAIVMDLVDIEAVTDSVGSDGRLVKGVDREYLAAGMVRVRQRTRRHSDVSREINFHRLRTHQPWSLPGDEQTIPF